MLITKAESESIHMHRNLEYELGEFYVTYVSSAMKPFIEQCIMRRTPFNLDHRVTINSIPAS